MDALALSARFRINPQAPVRFDLTHHLAVFGRTVQTVESATELGGPDCDLARCVKIEGRPSFPDRLLVTFLPVKKQPHGIIGPIQPVEDLERVLGVTSLPIERCAAVRFKGNLDDCVGGAVAFFLHRLEAPSNQFVLRPPDPEVLGDALARGDHAPSGVHAPFGATAVYRDIAMDVTWDAWFDRGYDRAANQSYYQLSRESALRVLLTANLAKEADRDRIEGRKILQAGIVAFLTANRSLTIPPDRPDVELEFDFHSPDPLVWDVKGSTISKDLRLGSSGRFIE